MEDGNLTGFTHRQSATVNQLLLREGPVFPSYEPDNQRIYQVVSPENMHESNTKGIQQYTYKRI